MLTETQIERYAFENEAIFAKLERRIMADIVRRIKKTKSITGSVDFQLNQLRKLGYTEEDIKKKLAEALNSSNEYVDKLYKEVIGEEFVRYKGLYEASARIFNKDDAQLENYIIAAVEQTNGEMANISRSLGFVVNTKSGRKILSLSEYYQQILDEALTDVYIGGFDYNKTIKKAIIQMTNSGVRFIDYDSGWHNRVTVAARRAVMTGLSQMSQQQANYIAEQLNIEYFEVSAHPGARPEHAIWQGKVYSKEELETKCGLGTVTGLLGANCYHVYFPFMPGVSKRVYTDKQLKDWEKQATKTWRGKEYTQYEATQKMRQMETNMRAQRQKIYLMKLGEADEEDIINERIKYRVQMAEYKNVAKHFSLKEQRERIYIDGLGRV